MNGKSTNGSLGGMACIEGLPPLPKSLSGLLNSSGGSWREMERMYVKKTMIQDDLSRGRNNADNLLANKPANLDAALALLRKEMVRKAESFWREKGAQPTYGGLSKSRLILRMSRVRAQPNSLRKPEWFKFCVALFGCTHSGGWERVSFSKQLAFSNKSAWESYRMRATTPYIFQTQTLTYVFFAAALRGNARNVQNTRTFCTLFSDPCCESWLRFCRHVSGGC